MKIKQQVIIFLLISTLYFPSYGFQINGNIPSCANSSITIEKYTDYIVNNTGEITEINVDSSGNFAFSYDIGGVNKYKIRTKDISASFFCANSDTVFINEVNGKLRVSGTVNSFNSHLKKINKDITDWRKLFINDSGYFMAINEPDKVLQILDSLERIHEVKDTFVNQTLSYYFANAALLFITTSYPKIDKPSAIKAFDSIEANYFIGKPIKIRDPFYLELLNAIVLARINNSNFSPVNSERFTSKISTFHYMHNETLNELCGVFVIKEYYNNKWYLDEWKSLADFNSVVEQIGTNDSIEDVKDYISQLIRTNNKTGIGSQFPLLKIVDVNGVDFDFTTIHTKYILVNFWATWCTACKEEMKEFPALCDKYRNDLTVVSICVDNKQTSMLSYLVKQGYKGKWTNLYNGDHGNYLNQLHIATYPSSFILDENRSILATPRTQDLLKELAVIVTGK